MSKPSNLLWPLKRHTRAKHDVLLRYVAAWIPILGSRFPHILIVDGFAGPGRYQGGEPGSPLLLLDAYCEHKARGSLGATPHFVFIEADSRRCAYLRDEIARDGRFAGIDINVVQGDFSEHFPKVFERLRAKHGDLPTFAFIDPFGADDEAATLTSQLIRLPRCEALIYVPINHLARFVKANDMEKTLDRLYGDRSWVEAKQFDDLGRRRAVLQHAFRKRMEQSCRLVRWFDIVPEEGGNTYSLFFGTNSTRGLQKMKDAMWRVDPASGSMFKDAQTPWMEGR